MARCRAVSLQVGGPEVLRVEEVEVPPPGEGEVQISIKAPGPQPRPELMFRRGQYLEEPKLPARLGYEAAGTVAAVGQDVQGFKVGDAVSTIPSFSLNDYGLYGDLANAPVHAVTHHPALALVGRGGGGLDAVPHCLRVLLWTSAS